MANIKAYISGPITGQDDYFKNFAKAETKLSRLGFAAINPAAINAALPSTTTHAEYMHVSFALIDLCGSGYNDPKWDIKKKIEQISSLPLIRYLTENELRHAFLGCYNPKEDVK